MTAATKTRLSRRRWLLAASALGASLPLTARAEPASPLAKVQPRLEALARYVRGERGKLSALLVALDGEERLAVDAGVALNPASNMKVVTAAAALDLLGPAHQFDTALYGTPSGTELPTLVLRGNGDPALSEPDLWRLASSLTALGVRKVDRLLVDQSRFDDRFVPPAFDQQPSEWASFRAPVSAIALERNSVTMNVMPMAAGAPARVWFQPVGVVDVQGQVATRQRGRGQNVQLELAAVGSALTARVAGHIAEGLPRQRFAKRVDDPRLLPGLTLKALLESLGVAVGSVALGGAEVKERITFHTSAPLPELLAELGKNSDNFYAEMVFKALGGTRSRGPASWQDASAVVADWLRKKGAFTPGTRVENGSGLFDANRLSAETLVAVLGAAWRSPRTSGEFVSHLAIGGNDGTLRSRFRAHKETRRIRAKTGTLRNVAALSGYVLRDAAAPYAFAIVVNDLPDKHPTVRAKIDEVVDALAAL